MLAVEGFRHCISYASRFSLETQRDAFVCSLAKFTFLATIKEMRGKNIECIKALLDLGLSEGTHLATSWVHILHCISHLERLQLIRNKQKPFLPGSDTVFDDKSITGMGTDTAVSDMTSSGR